MGGDDSDSDSESESEDEEKAEEEEEGEEDENGNIKLSDEELIRLLEEVKQFMNQRKQKRFTQKLDKLESAQRDMINIKFQERFLTISGSNGALTPSPKRNKRGKSSKNRSMETAMTFKEDVAGLIALCNS